MRSYDDTPFDTSDSDEPERDKRSKLPGGISVQTAAAGLIILVVVGLLWLLALPEPEPPETAATTTAGPNVGTVEAGFAVTATLSGGLGGTPVVGSLAATRAATSLARATPLIQSASLPTSEAAPGITPVATSAPALGSQLAEGAFVRITGTGIEGIRFRFGPGLEYATIRIAEEGEDLLVLGGPETADGVDWWRLQDSFGNVGWAAAQYLVVIAAPAGWSPPEASPTFETGLPTP